MENMQSIDNYKVKLLAEAIERYGSDAEFGYPTNGEYAVMTTAEAIERCGEHMAGEEVDKIWELLDKFKKVADIIRRDENRLIRARFLGQEALRR